MNIVLAARLQPKTGNHTTGMRIAEHLESGGHEVVPVNVNAPREERPELHDLDAAVGLHAYASAECLKNLSVPKVVVFGGTDINLDLNDKTKSQIIDDAVSNAASLVAISSNLLERAEARWPDLLGKMILIPQAVEVKPSGFSLRAHLGLPDEAKILLLPAGLRPVKDPLFVADSFSAWHKAEPSVYMVVCGEERDGEYSAFCKRELAGREGVIFAGALDIPDMHAGMLQSVAVLNTSVAEGNSVAILEAMALGVPVVARRNEGNEQLISAAQSGLLFSQPEECVLYCRSLLNDAELRRELAERGRRYIMLNHSLAAERASYLRLLDDMAGT